MTLLTPTMAAVFAVVVNAWDNPPGKEMFGVQHKTFRSESMKLDVGYNVYVPPGYADEPNRRYPVIYWLHGLGGNETPPESLVKIIDRAVKEGTVPPLSDQGKQ